MLLEPEMTAQAQIRRMAVREYQRPRRDLGSSTVFQAGA
jgi:hypothetical protein